MIDLWSFQVNPRPRCILRNFFMYTSSIYMSTVMNVCVPRKAYRFKKLLLCLFWDWAFRHFLIELFSSVNSIVRELFNSSSCYELPLKQRVVSSACLDESPLLYRWIKIVDVDQKIVGYGSFLNSKRQPPLRIERLEFLRIWLYILEMRFKPL